MSDQLMQDKAVLSCRNLGKSYEEGPQSVVVLADLQLDYVDLDGAALLADDPFDESCPELRFEFVIDAALLGEAAGLLPAQAVEHVQPGPAVVLEVACGQAFAHRIHHLRLGVIGQANRLIHQGLLGSRHRRRRDRSLRGRLRRPRHCAG